MNFLESLGFLYVVVCGIGFTGILLYMAFCGIRQYVDDARTGGVYRSEDERFRQMTRRG